MSCPNVSLAPLGVPLRVELGKASMLAAVEAACTGWRGGAEVGARNLRLQLAVSGTLRGTGAVEIAAGEHRLDMRGSGVAVWADAAAGEARCEVSADYLAVSECLREEVLEPLVLFLIARNGRPPVHASGFIVEGLAVLLSGPSGSGKTSLALAADRLGFQVLSEDTTHVQVEPQLRVWGWPRAAHLLPADAPGPASGQRMRGGRLKHVVPLRSSPSDEPVSCDSATFCLLARGGELELARIGPEDAMQRLERLEPGFDLIPRRIAQAHAALTRKGAWLLTLSGDPTAAVRFLAARLDKLRETAAP